MSKEHVKVNHPKLIIFEGFSSNGLQIRIQRKELHILALVKIVFDDFGDFPYLLQLLGDSILKD